MQIRIREKHIKDGCRSCHGRYGCVDKVWWDGRITQAPENVCEEMQLGEVEMKYNPFPWKCSDVVVVFWDRLSVTVIGGLDALSYVP